MYSFLEDLYRYTVSDKSDFQNIILKFSETEPHILKILTTKLKLDSIICNSFKKTKSTENFLLTFRRSSFHLMQDFLTQLKLQLNWLICHRFQ